MSTLLVIAYPDNRAHQALAEMRAAQDQFVVRLSDAVVVTKDAKGKVKLDQSVNLGAAGAVSGSFWGMLIGLIFLAPWLGLVVGAVSGWLGGKFSDYGIPDKFIKEVGQKLQPGGSQLFLLVESATEDKFQAALAKHGGEIIQTSISEEDTRKLQAYLDKEGGKISADVSAAMEAQQTSDSDTPPAQA
jgi:uncharacterized membrane protein